MCTCISMCMHVYLTYHVIHTFFRMCTNISTCIYVHPTPHVSSPMDSYMETWVPLCGSQSPCFWSDTLGRMCMHQYINICAPDCPCLFHALCIVWWKHGCPCVALCVCHNHPTSVPPPWLECVHALVHGFMSTLLLMLAQPPMHSLMETWVPLYVSVFVSQWPCLCSNILFRIFPCTSTWIYVHLTAHICSTPMHSLMETVGAPVCQCVCVPVTSFLFPHLV